MNKLTQYNCILILMAVVMTACGQKDFVKTDSGLEYLKVKEGTGERPNDGDYMLISVSYNDAKDSVLFSSVKSGSGPLPLKYVDSVFTNNGSLEEAFKLCGKGDSIILKIPAATIFKESFRRPVPDTIPAESIITVYMGIDSILNPEDFQTYKMAQITKQRAKAEEAAKVQIELDKKTIENYLKENDIDAKSTEEGLFYVITKEGNGEKPAAGDTVVVNYTGKLLNGTMFDSSIEEDAKAGGVYNERRTYDKPFEFVLGQGRVIKGWDLGVAELSKGSKATLYIPSSLAYGARGAGGKIGPNSILKFDIELIDIK